VIKTKGVTIIFHINSGALYLLSLQSLVNCEGFCDLVNYMAFPIGKDQVRLHQDFHYIRGY